MGWLTEENDWVYSMVPPDLVAAADAAAKASVSGTGEAMDTAA
jgi:hypothetical protein